MDAKEGVARLVSAAEKLLMETSRLKRDVETLSGRIQKFDDEIIPWQEPISPRKAWNIVDALNMIDEARISIRNSEYDLSAIRGRMDAIESDAISRAEMKPFIK